MTNRQAMIDRLVGVQSSKQNYYVALKNSMNEMKKKNMQLEIINDVMKGFNIEMSVADMFQLILNKMQPLFSFKHLSLFELHPEHKQLQVHTIYPRMEKDNITGKFFSKDNSLFWEVARKKVYYNYIVDEKDDFVEVKFFKRLFLQQVLIFPMYVQGKMIGLFSLGNEEISTYDEEDLRFLQQLTDQIAVSHENVRLYREVLHKKNEWEQTFSAVKDSILLVDTNGDIVQANETANQYFQLQDNYLSLDHLLYGDEMPEKAIFERCIEEKKPIYEEIKLLNGAYCEVYAYPVFHDSKKLIHVIVYVRDITKKRQYEVQILQSGKLAAIGEMAAGVAHELNNPLTAILGNAQLLLRKEAEDSSTYHLLHDVYACGKRSQNIIRNLLTFSRQDEYLFEQCSVNDAVHNVLDMIGYQMKLAQIQMELELDAQLPLIAGNIQQIEQVIINLILNAKDALKEEENDKVIKIETTFNEAFVYVTVHDNGIGMDEEEKNHIFDPFFTTKKVREGTGLGLSVSLGIAESHQGSIQVESERGEGSSITLRLPLEIEDM